MTSWVRTLALVLLTAASPVHSSHQGGLGGPIGGTPSQALWPVDEATSRPDFFAFRARLQVALARRDVDALLAVVAPEIRSSFGDDHGLDGFLRRWTLRDPGSRLWEELATVLALGGTFESDDMFVAPYVFSRWPDGVDPFDHVALVGAAVPMLAAPRADADSIGAASFVILPRARPDAGRDDSGWTAVQSGDRTAYVPATLVRSPIDYRAFFARRDGGWKMVMFVAGD